MSTAVGVWKYDVSEDELSDMMALGGWLARKVDDLDPDRLKPLDQEAKNRLFDAYDALIGAVNASGLLKEDV